MSSSTDPLRVLTCRPLQTQQPQLPRQLTTFRRVSLSETTSVHFQCCFAQALEKHPSLPHTLTCAHTHTRYLLQLVTHSPALRPHLCCLLLQQEAHNELTSYGNRATHHLPPPAKQPAIRPQDVEVTCTYVWTPTGRFIFKY